MSRHHGGARRGGVRYSGRGYYGYGPRGRYGYGYGYGYGGYWRAWGGGWGWGYPVGAWGWGVAVGIGVGYSLAFWDPWYYRSYGNYWVNGAPAFGYGTAYYGPSYGSYFEQPVYAEEPVYAEDPVYYEEVVVEEGAPAPAPAQAEGPALGPANEPAPEAEGPPLEDEIDPESAPGRTEFGAGVDAFLEGDYAGALGEFQAAVEADPNNGEGWMAVAQSAFAAGEYEPAAEAIEKAAELGAFPRGYRYDPTPMYPEEGRFDELLQNLETYRQKNPKDPDGHLVGAFFDVALGKKSEAMESIQQVLELNPADETAPLLNEALLPPLPPAEPTEEEQQSLPAPPTR